MGHPVTIAALIVLMVNDVVLKDLVPGAFTGKLSDVAGLVVFPVVVATLVGLVLRDDDATVLVAVTGVGLWFAGMKTLPAVATATESLAELLVGHARVTVDPTDLLALPAVSVAVWVWRHRLPPRVASVPVLLVAATWSMATSCDPGSTWDRVQVMADGSFVVDFSDTGAVIDPSGRLLHDDRPVDVPRDLTERRTSICPGEDLCIHADGHDIIEDGPDGPRRVVDIPESRLLLADRESMFGCGDDLRGVGDIAANDAGVVVVAHGSHGIAVRAADGQWSRPPVQGAWEPDAHLPPELHLAVLGLTLAGFLLATWSRSPAQSGLNAAGVVLGLLAVATTFNVDAPLMVTAFLAVGVFAAVPLIARPVETGGGYIRRTALLFLVTAIVGEVLAWMWDRGWVEDLRVAGGLAVALVVAVTVMSIWDGISQGAWPTPRPLPPPPPPWDP